MDGVSFVGARNTLTKEAGLNALAQHYKSLFYNQFTISISPMHLLHRQMLGQRGLWVTCFLRVERCNALIQLLESEDWRASASTISPVEQLWRISYVTSTAPALLPSTGSKSPWHKTCKQPPHSWNRGQHSNNLRLASLIVASPYQRLIKRTRSVRLSFRRTCFTSRFIPLTWWPTS